MQRELMKGDPLRGVHAFYATSAREWWAPLVPDRRVFRRNALVGVLDKPSEFAERAVHEWTAQVFRDEHDTLLCAQFRNMVRTERTKAREKKKYDDITIEPYTDDAIAEIEARTRSETRRGAEPRWFEDVQEGDEIGPMVKGPLTVTDMICWHVGMGMGLYGVQPLRLGVREPAADPAVLPSRRPQRARRDAAGALGSRVRSAIRQPDDLRLRPHARDVAHPPVHRLDGRRRLAVEARLRVPPVQLRGRHAVAAGNRDPQVPRRRRPPGRRPRPAGRQPARRAHHAWPRHDPAAEPRARTGPLAGSARWCHRSARRARRDRRRFDRT